MRIDSELDVAATGVYTDRANDLDANVAHVLELNIGQGQRRRHRDGVPCVHAHRVKVFDRTHHDDVVVLVAHELEFVLFPAQDGFFKQNLGADGGLQP
ncbi:unannotated protein [freshwater metagenome]|uniref:Unannotated protein n=1 Tax=freshwater metagenome TaxID=449393 RepID=A0A6J6VKF7_9ZZZZ